MNMSSPEWDSVNRDEDAAVPEPFAPERQSDRGGPDSTAAARVDDELLEEVLRATLLAENADKLSPAEMAAFVDVARLHRNCPLCSEPIAVELVSSLLRVRFGTLMAAPELRREVSQRIASTLFDDPREQLFLQRFWQKLREAAQ
jgi:hypothetical protein